MALRVTIITERPSERGCKKQLWMPNLSLTAAILDLFLHLFLALLVKKKIEVLASIFLKIDFQLFDHLQVEEHKSKTSVNAFGKKCIHIIVHNQFVCYFR